MSSQRPGNTFRNVSQQPRPKATNAPTERASKTERNAGAVPFITRCEYINPYRELTLGERSSVYAGAAQTGAGVLVLSEGVSVAFFLVDWVRYCVKVRACLGNSTDGFALGETFGTDESSHVYKKWRSYDNISKEVALAVVASEDQAFPTHWGFDFDEIQDAIKENETRKRPRGASTISQQVAKNVFLWNGAVISAKVWKYILLF